MLEEQVLSFIHEPEAHSKERDGVKVLIKNISLVLYHIGNHDEAIHVVWVTDILQKKSWTTSLTLAMLVVLGKYSEKNLFSQHFSSSAK